ncbi:MAG: hypothetical protein LBI33_14445 [Propionibacteriaceae bacterium]|jgi:protein-S-isoprenylcysteine O-methyltransferase Ste14|nr:hypothetical protein [Propionibacteriaceae bacterium]
MAVQGWLVLVAFASLIGLVLGRVVILRRHGIAAFLFGATHKSDALLVPCLLAVAYAVAAPSVGWPVWRPLVAPFWATGVPGWVGVVGCLTAVAGLAWTLTSFGDAFRVGIDDHRPGGLVTTGAFAVSRNPVYVCFLLFLTGLFLVAHNLVTVVALTAYLAVVHRQILREEHFLASHYGEAFAAYQQRVRRYL